MTTLFLGGDVMLGRGIDQVLPHPCPPNIYERAMISSEDYVLLAQEANGPIGRGLDYAYPWGEGIAELAQVDPDLRIINLETAVTRSEDYEFKGINYRVSPENAACLEAASIDCCVLANNHVLDWGHAGLLETFDTLDRLAIRRVGAGRDAREASAPAVLPLRGGGRVLVFAWGMPSSGVDREWAATEHSPGVNYLGGLTAEAVRRIAARVKAAKRTGDVVIGSLHWGPNFGYSIPREHVDFAHKLIDEAGIDLVYGHSSHHPKGMEVYRGHLVLYGCGDLMNDYEGISGHEDYRPQLVLMYFPTLSQENGTLAAMEMAAFRLRRFRLERASRDDAEWLCRVLTREGARFGTTLTLRDESRMALRWS